MDNLLENNGIKEYTNKMIKAESKAREEQEMVIAFLQKNMPEIKNLVAVGQLSSQPEDVVKFVNNTCDLNIKNSKEVDKFISDQFKTPLGRINYSKYISFLFACVINYAFWYIFVRAVDVGILWPWEISANYTMGIAIVLSFLSILFASLTAD